MSSSGPPEPAASSVFGPRLSLAQRYAELLAGPGVERGLLGPREVPRVWERHLLNCAVVAELVPAGATVADVGSGAGLPGIPLALARPDLRVDLVEPLARRVAFLDLVLAELALPGIRVVRARARELHRRSAYDVVVARAVAPLGELVAECLPLVRPKGVLLALKGRTVAREIEGAGAALRAYQVTTHQVGGGLVEPPTIVVEIRRRSRG